MRYLALVLALLIASNAAEARTRHRRSAPAAPALSAETVNAADPAKAGEAGRALLIRVAVLLDRARVSPGAIDGRKGDNVDKAVRTYRRDVGLSDEPRMDADLLAKLTEADGAAALVDYTVTEDDAKGPFTPKISARLEDQANLKRLGYRDTAELLAERFHMDVGLLRELNRGKPIDQQGTVVTVANVASDGRADPSRAAEIASGKGIDRKEAAAQRKTVARIAVDKKTGTLTAFGQDGGRVLFAPVSVGSPEKPAPSGTLHVVRVAPNPSYTYNPKYAFKGVKSEKPFDIAPGPNNPVGSVWIALDREGYGIHGTPEPVKVGKTQSHGCIRLTNWTALQLAGLVEKGVPVEFGE